MHLIIFIIMKAKAILIQLAVALIQLITKKDTYPSVAIWGYWESYVGKDNKTHYKQFKSLWNYIKNKKTY